MKRIILIFAAFASTVTVFAQGTSTNSDAFFAFDDNKQAIEIHTLGSDPEFPFMRNLSTSQQVYSAIKKNERAGTNPRSMARLNGLLTSIGFENGTKDLRASDITAAHIPSGSMGNMGSGKLDDNYYKLTGDPNGYRAWKVTSPTTGEYVYFFAACGNAFYPNANAGKTACIKAGVNLTNTPKEITVNSNPATMLTDKTYVYYHMKKYRKNDDSYARREIADATPSKPLLLSAKKRVEATPTTYKLSVASQTDNVTVCPDKPVEVAADINVEQISSYTGNYLTANQGYKEISKRAYKRAERKMRHVEKKEAKVGAITGVPVDRE